MSKNYRLLDLIRRSRSPLENHLIDGLIDGRVSRRDFIRHGSLLGLSLPLLGGISAAAGLGAMPSLARAAGAPGATIRVASSVPAAAIDPVNIADAGGLLVMQQVAEFLCIDGPDLVLQPVLAESWTPNEDGTVWTFKLRQGVKFHSGSDDEGRRRGGQHRPPCRPGQFVQRAVGFQRHICQKGGDAKVDDHTVEFHLDAPNGNFPYMVSSDNYNAVILPADYKGDFEKSFDRHRAVQAGEIHAQGRRLLRAQRRTTGAAKALPDRIEFTFFADMQPQILALQGGQVDIIKQMPVLAGRRPAQRSECRHHQPAIDGAPAGAHAQRPRSVQGHAGAPRHRARASTGRSLSQGLMKGRAKSGNDSPFAAAYPSHRPERAAARAEHRRGQAADGSGRHGNGFKMTLTTERYLEIPEYAVLIQNAVKEIGIKLKLNILDQGAYYGDAVFGKSPGSTSVMGITDYGHRGVPNVFLQRR